MFLCKRFIELDKMFSRLSDALQTAADVIAPPPTLLQEFEYHWKQVKNFYAADKEPPKVHVNDTSLPHYIEGMLQILIREQTDKVEVRKGTNECMDFLLTNHLLDVLEQLSVADSPPGMRVCVLNWVRRLLSCLENPPLEHCSLFQPIQTFVKICDGRTPSPYEQEEILFLETVAGLVRKDPFLMDIFLPSHQHSAKVSASLRGTRAKKQPTKNPLFDCSKVETNIRRIEILPDETNLEEIDENNTLDATKTPAAESSDIQNEKTKEQSNCNKNCDIKSLSNDVKSEHNENAEAAGHSKLAKCDCEETDRFNLLDAILTYFESPDSKIVVRACEGALLACSSPTLDINCSSVCASLDDYITFLILKLVYLSERIPEDIEPGDVEELNVSWGLIPRETDHRNFIGRAQLYEFLCWMDYTDCIARECHQLQMLGPKFRSEFLVGVIEPALIAIDAPFMLVLMSKVIKQLRSKSLMEEIANWLVGEDMTDTYARGDCLLNIIIENAQDNAEVLLSAMQFIEALLDNPHERILHEMIFRYINNRGYYDMAHAIQSWSDEEEERSRRRGSADGAVKSRTLAPHNILKVINNFLLLLPRQIMAEATGTCYEEYVQDASRHYQNWIKKTAEFSWPIEAVSPSEKEDISVASVSPSASLEMRRSNSSQPASSSREPQCNDSGISEESFYEGSLLKLLFSHVRLMAVQPCEINLAIIAILSKLAFLPHPYLHELLLNPEIPTVHGVNTLWSSMQIVSRQLLLEIPKHDNFQKKIGDASKRLLTNPPLMCENSDENDSLFEAIVVLEEFCKELAAIAFVKYHHATE